MPPTHDLPDLERFVAEVLSTLGVPGDRAALGASCLLHADARGVHTHGIGALATIYAPGLRSGAIDPAARPRVVQRTGAVEILDGARSLGLATGAEAMDRALELASASGVGVVAVRNSTHFGPSGFYTSRAADRGAVGIAMTNCGTQGVLPPLGGATRMLGTNPISVAMPAGGDDRFVLDMSTSVVATGQVKAAARRDQRVPDGWLHAAGGGWTNDPSAYLDGTAEVAWLGGDLSTGGAKGFGLALVVDLLCGAFSGAGFGPHPGVERGSATEENDVGHFFLAIDGAAGASDFAVQADTLLGVVAGSAPAAGRERVTYPGQPEAEKLAAARAGGVALPEDIAQSLSALADEVGVAWPQPVAEARA